MANDYGYDLEYRVYKIVSTGEVGNFETVYSLVYEVSANSEAEAKEWITNKGKRLTDYTYLPVYRNK